MKNIPEESIQVLLSSISSSTIKQYNSTIKDWWIFRTSRGLDILNVTIPEVIVFLQDIFDKKKNLGHGSFNNIRSALSLILPLKLGKDFYVKRFLRGVSRLRPYRRKFDLTWNPDDLLDYLGRLHPNNDISLCDLSHKLISLLALVTAHRFQTFALIKLENIIFNADGNVLIFITDDIKTSGPGKTQPCLQFPFLQDNPSICLANTLMCYIDRTSNLRRDDNEYLFVTYGNSHHRASSQTLSRWVKETLRSAGVDTDVFRAYSIRSVATSTAFRRQVPIELIRRTAGWTEKSNTFFKFYNKTISLHSNEFALAILNQNGRKGQ